MHTRGYMIIIALIGCYFGACRGIYRFMEWSREWFWPWRILPIMFAMGLVVFIELTVGFVVLLLGSYLMDWIPVKYHKPWSCCNVFFVCLGAVTFLVLCRASLMMGRWLEVNRFF